MSVDISKIKVNPGFMEHDPEDAVAEQALLDLISAQESEGSVAVSRFHLPRKYLSISSMGMYQRCPRQFYFRYVMGLSSPPGIAMVEGSTLHKTVESMHKVQMEEKKIHPLDVYMDHWNDQFKELSSEVEDWEEQQPQEIETRGMSFVKMYYQDHLPKAKPTGVEQEIRWNANGVPVLGFIDLVDKKQGVIDHKVTGRSKSQRDVDNSMQLTLYAAATGRKEVGFNSFVKTKVPKIDVKRGVREPWQIEDMNETFESVAEAITKGAFPLCGDDNPLCSAKYCGFWSRCRGRTRTTR